MNSIEDINLTLSTLSVTSNDEYLRRFEEFHVKLFDELAIDNSEHHSRILESWQKYCEVVPGLDLSDGRPVYFSPIAPRLSSFLSGIVAEIDHLFNNYPQTETTMNNITRALQRIIHVLEPLNLSFQKVPKGQTILEDSNIDFIMYFGDILITIFQHCQNYRTIYSNVLLSVNQLVSSVLKTCCEVHNQYINFVQSLALNSEDTNDLDGLIKVTNKLFLIGVAVSNLDVKTMALQWKGFLNFLELHSVYLRSEFDLSPIIEFFYKEITEKIKSLYENTDAGYRNVTLKILCFLIKIIGKLCSYWCENLEKFVSSLLRLILFLYDHSITCSKYSKVKFEIIEEIDRSLLAGVDSLISLLINDRSFIRFYTVKNIKKLVDIQNEAVILLLLCTILQKLVTCTDDVQNLWFQHLILDTSLNLISEFHSTLSYEFKISSNFFGNAKLSREIFLYDTLLVNISSLIISDYSGLLFDSLEITLITHLLRAPLSVKIFISDVWCIVDRYGDSELCLTHVIYLRSVLEELQCGKPEAVILLSLIRRLFKFLSPKQQIQLLQDADSDFLLTNSLKSLTDRHLEKAVMEAKHLKHSLKDDSTFDERIRLLRLTTVIRKCNVAVDGDYDSWMKDLFLTEQWSSIVELFTNLKLDDIDRTADLIFYLCCVTSLYIVTLSPLNILQLLKHVNDFLTCESSLVLLNVQKVLKACGMIRFGNSHARELSTVLKSLFSICLRNQNSIVKQCSLESFSYFCHITIHDTVIQETIGSDLKLKEDLALYLQKKFRKSHYEKKIEDFISNLSVRTAEEIYDKEKEKDSNVEKFAPKKIKLHSSVLVKINEAETILDDLIKIIHCEDALDANEKIKLNKLLDNVDKLRKFV